MIDTKNSNFGSSVVSQQTSRLRRLLRHAAVLLSLVGVAGATMAEPPPVPLRVGAETGFPPFADVDADGRATGFSVELFAAVAKALDMPIEFAPSRWDVVWQGLIRGEYDALPLVARMDERKGLVELTQPHTIGYDAFFVRRGSPPVGSIEEARALTVIVLKSDAAHHALASRGFGDALVQVDSLADGFRLLASGQHDALLAPLLQGNMVNRQTGLAGVVESGPLLAEYRREFCFAVRKGDLALRDRLDRGLALVKANGEYDRLYRKWLEIYEPAVFPAGYLAWIVGAVFLVIGLMALWTWSLRRLVRLRTNELTQAHAAVHAERQRLSEMNAVLEERVVARTAEAMATEMRFRAMADSAPTYMWVAGPDQRCLWFNKPWLEFAGRSMQEELDDGWAARLHPDDAARCRDTYTHCFDRRESFEMEYRMRRADGEYRWLLDRGMPHVGPDGKFLGYVGSCVDISARKQAEMELNAATAEAERANDAKSRFLAAASHDLRQPLSALALYIGVLSNRADSADAAIVANMRDCVGSLSAMLTDLLDLSKLEAGVVAPNICDFAVDEMLAKIASAYAPKASAKALELRRAACNVAARSDPVLFHRMVANLVANAVRYTERGGVLVGCRRRGGKLWIEVWDTGIGIAADKTAVVFEEFTQLRPGAGNQEQGSGLGLTIVAKTAALLGLAIRVASRVGHGSLFALELPVGESVTVAAPPRLPQRSLRIALVDDSATVRLALAYALSDAGHQVVAAATRKELVGRLGAEAPDIVISDYRLAGRKTGFEVVTSVRTVFGADLPALIITGDTDPKVLRRMAGKGVRVLHKPIDPGVLRACIAELVAAAPAPGGRAI